MESWSYKKFSEVCILQRGFDLPKSERKSGKYPLISSSGYIDFHSEAKVSGPGVVTGRSGSIGQIFYIPEDFWPLNTALYVKDFLGNDPRFISYFLKQFDLGRYTSGAGVPTLNRNHVHDEQVFVPNSVKEQKRIVAILDQVFSDIEQARAKTEKNLKNARELFESYLQQVFSDQDEGWAETTLGNEVDLLTGFAFKSKEYVTHSDSTPLIRGDNIIQGKLRWDDVKLWANNKISEYEKYQLKVDDIVLAMDRTWVKAGMKFSRITSQDLPALLVQRVARLRCLHSLDSDYLYHIIGSKLFENYVLSIQTGLGVPHISGKQIQSFKFSKPKIDMQKRIALTMNKLQSEALRLNEIYINKLTALDELKKSILQKAFTGQLTNKKSKKVAA